MAGPLGDRAHLLGAEPGRACCARASTRSRTARSSSCSTCSRTRAAKGLHVGHPLGYIGTDVYARFKRMTGHNVLHAMGYDAFGLPAEQYAVQTGQHPRVTTEANIANMRRQLRALGLGHDPRRSVATTDPAYYRWTQWIFLQIFNSWYDEDADRARPIAELIPVLGGRSRRPTGPTWTRTGRRELVDSYRLAYLAEAPVNWCPALGTVLANEEVTADGRSERGNHPGLPAAAEAVDAAHHRVRRPAARRPRPARLDRLDQADAAQLDRAQRRRRGRLPGRGPRGRRSSRSSRRAPTRCSARPTWCSRPSTRSSTRSRPPSGRARRSARTSTTSPPSWHGHLRRRGGPGRRGAPLPRVRRAEERARAPGRGQGEDRRVHRRVRDQPRQRRADPDLHRRLRADGLRHRRDHGRARPRPARLRVRARSSTCRSTGHPPPASWFDSTASRRRAGSGLARGVRRRRGRDELGERRRLPRRPARRRREAGDHRVARGSRSSASRDRHLQAARLAVQPAALLGRAVPDRLRRARSPGRGARVAAAGRAARDHRLRARDRRRRRRERAAPAARARRAVGRRSTSTSRARLGRRRRRAPRRTAASTNTMPQWAGSCWYYLRYLDPTNENAFVGRRGRAVLDGARARAASTSTSAASSTRCCTCCTRASGTRCCSTSATSRRRSRSSGSSTRATSSPPRSRDERGVLRRGARRSSNATARFFHDDAGCSASSARWARA